MSSSGHSKQSPSLCQTCAKMHLVLCAALLHSCPLLSSSCSRSAAWCRGSWMPGRQTTKSSKAQAATAFPLRPPVHGTDFLRRVSADLQAIDSGSRSRLWGGKGRRTWQACSTLMGSFFQGRRWNEARQHGPPDPNSQRGCAEYGQGPCPHPDQ